MKYTHKTKPSRVATVIAECQGHTLYKVQDGAIEIFDWNWNPVRGRHKVPRIFRIDSEKFGQRYAE